MFYKSSVRVNFFPQNAIGYPKCREYDRCFTCIQDSKCGFCYSKRGENYIKTVCIPLNVTGGRDMRPDACSVDGFGGSRENVTTVMNWSTVSCPTDTAWLAVFGMIFFLTAFAMGVGPLPWTINAEMYPLWARNIGQSAATTTNWIINLLISLTFLNLIEVLTQAGVFLFYGIISFIGCIFLYLLLPETKGVRLENVGKLFDGKIIVPCNK